MPKTQTPEQLEIAAATKRMWQLAFTKKALVITSCIFAVLGVAVSFVPFVAIYFIIQELVPHMGEIGGVNSAYLIRMGWLAGGSAIASVLLNFIALMCSHVAAFSTLHELKIRFANHLASLPLGFHTENSTGKLRKIIDENIEKIEGFIAHQLPDLVGSFATPVIVLGILFVFDWRLGLASLVPIILVYVMQMIFMGDGSHIKTYQDSLESMSNAAVEYVRGISVIKAFNQTIFSFRKFHETIMAYGDFALRYTKSFKTGMSLFMMLLNHIFIFIVPVAIWLFGRTEDYPRLAMATLFYLIFSMAITGPFLKLMYVSQKGRQIADGIMRMDKVFSAEPLPRAANPKTEKGYDIAFENVAFTYNENGKVQALQSISFTAKQNEITALVGPSGSGKSTIAHLIPRFYDVQTGSIKIGGVDIRDMATEHLMSIVSFVFQDVFLFQQSVLDNIHVGDKNATLEQVKTAAKAAQCHYFIEKLPQGYNTLIGTNNVHLSGGEKQRIVIARAILKNAPIIVLDEATAFADPENEHKIQLAFEKLMKGKTVIIIAHRLSTVRGANSIVVIDEGCVVEEGTHETLQNGGGRYSRMWEQYVSSMSWSIADKGARV